MAKVQFIGRALPTVFSIQTVPQNVTWKDSTGRELIFDVRVANSLVNVIVDCPNYTPADATEVYKHAYDLARASLNLVAFAAGMGIIVIFDILIDPDGNPTVLQPQDVALKEYCTVFSLLDPDTTQFNDLFRILASDPILFRLLNDLIETLWNPGVAPVNCGRVIDGIRRQITPPGTTNEKTAWGAMHAALNISRDYQEYISNVAKGPRHADPAYVDGTITHDVSHRSWIIMNRFLEYRKAGNVALDIVKFPLMT